MTPTDTELWFDYVLRPRSRVSAGKSGAVQNVRPIHTVIPGTVVRGAIGSAFWSARGGLAAEGVDSARELFDETFRRGLTVYHAVPFTKGRATGAPSAEDVVAAQVNIGTTMVRCKYEHAHLGWHDIVAQPLSRDRCPRCAGGLERGKGWTAPDPSMLPGAGGSPLTVATTRTALRPDGSSKDEQLFTRKALVTDIELRGRVRLVTADPAQAGTLQRWMAGLGELSIGGQRSTLGRCTWSMAPVAEPPAAPTADRVILRLESPGILVDALGAATTDLGAVVQSALSTAGSSSVVVSDARWVRSTTVSGWHGMAGLPKSEELAVDTGSSVVIEHVDDGARDVLMRGVGLRRAEGYGAIELVDPSTQPSALSGIDEAEATSPQGVVVEEPVKGAAPAPAVDAVATLAAELGEQRVAPVLRAVVNQARGVKRWRGNGFSEQLIRSNLVEPLSSQPWMRPLAEPIQARIRAILLAPPEILEVHLGRIETELRERS